MPGKHLLHAITVRVRVAICHRIHHDHHVVAEIVCTSRCRLHAHARCNTRQKDLGDAALTQVLIERRANKRAHSLLAHQVIVRLLLQFGNKFGPIVRERKLARPGVSTARSHGRHVDENDGQTSFAESARKLGQIASTISAVGMRSRNTDDTLLQVNHDQGSGGIERCDGHGLPFRRISVYGADARRRIYLACFFAKFTLNIMLIAAMPAKKTTSAMRSPLETSPTRNRT